ncbi:MAG: MurR/RpiR family transcriptional regulator [Oscillospiraceae bacterium]|nr:MurR/RpiR family transcriptional regulator [Oscillospiraceae bacterium]
MKQDLLKKIEVLLPSMSKNRRAIGNFILEHYDKAAYITAAKLGSQVNVSESTVVRFAIELGFAGYPELQQSLQELIRTKLTSLQRIEITNKRIGDSDVLEKVLNSDITKIRSTLDTIDRDDFNRAVSAIIDAKMIYIVGMRSAASLAAFLSFYFRLIFANVTLVQTTSGSELFEQILRLNKEDVLIAITFPRYSKNVVRSVEYAKHIGAHIIALTDSKLSPIAESADSLLLAKSDMASFVDSLVAPLSIINALIVAISKIKQEEFIDIFGKLENIWEEYEVYEKTHE